MIKKIFIKWINIGYSAMMFGERKEKPHDWQGNLKYVFDTYLFSLFTALLTNIFLELFPFEGVFKVLFILLFPLIGIYTYRYNKLFKKLLFKVDFDPSMNYKKNSFKDFTSVILMLSSVAIAFLSFVYSFYVFNYFKYIIGNMIN